MKGIVTTLLFMLLLLAGTAGEAAAITMVSVAGEKVNMRKGPSTKYSIKWELGKGFPLRVIGSQGNWLKVSDFERSHPDGHYRREPDSWSTEACSGDAT